MKAESLITLDSVSFTYNNAHAENNGWIYRDFDFAITRKSITAIMGPSGGGKSTLGLLLSDMIHPIKGRIGKAGDLASPSDIVYIDQHSMNSVFPWQTVRKNIEYPLVRLGWLRRDAVARADELLSTFGIEHLAHSLPCQLSGGELQRLALCRGVSWKPKLLVLDESLSALDSNTKTRAISSIHETAVSDGVTVVLITHSIADALSFATRCIILGERPVKIACDVEIECPFPRDDKSEAFRTAQEAIIETIRHGVI